MLLKKYALHIAMVLAASLIILVPYLKEGPDPVKIERATVAAMDFLKLVDTGDYEAARKEGAALLKERVTLNDWIAKLAGVQVTLGPVLKREQVEASYSTTARNSPDGEYVMLTFTSNFKQKVGVSETIIVMLDKNRGWRVAGYFFK